MENILYIGLNGYAGSGKDTVAKMLRTMLDFDWKDKEECRQYYKRTYKNPTISATFNPGSINKVMCIAYADQLKEICSSVFGIPVERFYTNKGNAWININHNFEYTEIKPSDHCIISAEQFYEADYETNGDIWMSLRDVLVYVGTYVLQQTISKSVFINIVRNKIKEESLRNENFKYVIVTDNRFQHELDYIHENNGITITIKRDSVEQLNNIAEHDLDDETNYDLVIHNDAGYGELFDTLWDMVHNLPIFKNETIDLITRDNINNYIRLVEGTDVYTLCSPMKFLRVSRSGPDIALIDPTGGPMIVVGEKIQAKTDDVLMANRIWFDENKRKFLLQITKIIE